MVLQVLHCPPGPPSPDALQVDPGAAAARAASPAAARTQAEVRVREPRLRRRSGGEMAAAAAPGGREEAVRGFGNELDVGQDRRCAAEEAWRGVASRRAFTARGTGRRLGWRTQRQRSPRCPPRVVAVPPWVGFHFLPPPRLAHAIVVKVAGPRH